MTPEEKLIELGLELPKPLVMPVGATLPFPWVKLVDKTLYISGHVAQKTDGTIAGHSAQWGLIFQSKKPKLLPNRSV